MFQVKNLTNDAKQKQTLVLPDGTFVELSLYFIPMQYGWFIASLVYQNFELNGLRITNSPNLLYQWKNKIPFGLACTTQDDREPSQANDFSSGASKLFILTADEVQQFSDFLET